MKARDREPGEGLLSEGRTIAIDAQSWTDVRRWRKEARERLIAARMAMTAPQRRAHAASVNAALQHLLAGSAAEVIGFYWPFKGEFDPRPLVHNLHAAGRHLALPVVVDKAAPLIFRSWWPDAPMTEGIWNIPIPAEGEPVQPDLLLVPMVGFDRRLYRLGYGGGFYDRTLAATLKRPVTIGLGHAICALDTLYPQPHDIPMNHVVTEDGVLSAA